MNLPIEQVERIEVIRGPGSILYGEYAFSGVINVVTYTNTNRGFVGYSRYNSPVAGGTLYRELAEGVTISLNLSFNALGAVVESANVLTGVSVVR